MKQLSIEYGFEFEQHGRPASENINNLICAIQNRAKNESSRLHHIVVLDEVEFWNNQSDLSPLQLDDEYIDIYAAINPYSRMCQEKLQVILPNESDSTTSRQLLQCHRNSLEISIFLLHLKRFIEAQSIRIQPMDEDNNQPIIDSCLETKKLPILIYTDNETTDQEVLDSVRDVHILPGIVIRDDHVLPIFNNVVLIYDDLEGERKDAIAKWCSDNNWKMVHSNNMVGSEASATILFELKNDSIEFYSRAKYCLIIVHQ